MKIATGSSSKGVMLCSGLVETWFKSYGCGWTGLWDLPRRVASVPDIHV